MIKGKTNETKKNLHPFIQICQNIEDKTKNTKKKSFHFLHRIHFLCFSIIIIIIPTKNKRKFPVHYSLLIN